MVNNRMNKFHEEATQILATYLYENTSKHVGLFSSVGGHCRDQWLREANKLLDTLTPLFSDSDKDELNNWKTAYQHQKAKHEEQYHAVNAENDRLRKEQTQKNTDTYNISVDRKIQGLIYMTGYHEPILVTDEAYFGYLPETLKNLSEIQLGLICTRLYYFKNSVLEALKEKEGE